MQNPSRNQKAFHKAKGKEYDNVYILLENFNALTDTAKRQLYVAMTRAKQQLIIHFNGSYLNNIQATNRLWLEDHNQYLPPYQLVIHLTHEDINLGYFEFVQHRLLSIMSGDALIIAADGCKNAGGEMILKFSKKFTEIINNQAVKGYQPTQASVNFVLYWKKPDQDLEIKIILPELIFECKAHLNQSPDN